MAACAPAFLQSEGHPKYLEAALGVLEQWLQLLVSGRRWTAVLGQELRRRPLARRAVGQQIAHLHAGRLIRLPIPVQQVRIGLPAADAPFGAGPCPLMTITRLSRAE